MSEVLNQDLWKKSCRVSQGISKLIWACNYYYIYCTVEDALEEYGVDVYVNDYGMLTVKLDDDTEYELIRHCPHLIYNLYDAKSKIECGETDVEVIRKAKAYDKFEPFFKWMTGYVDTNI